MVGAGVAAGFFISVDGDEGEETVLGVGDVDGTGEGVEGVFDISETLPGTIVTRGLPTVTSAPSANNNSDTTPS